MANGGSSGNQPLNDIQGYHRNKPKIKVHIMIQNFNAPASEISVSFFFFFGTGRNQEPIKMQDQLYHIAPAL